VTDASVDAADRVLRRHGIRYVVVGGQAVARDAATTTQDVDVMVTTDAYRAAIQQLGSDEELTLAWDGGAVARFGFRDRPGMPLDIVDAGAFSGTKSGAEFFAFLVDEASVEVDGIRYISPEAVWYTRLLTKRWRVYAEKIVTNVVDGISAERLAGVERIARRFGTEGTIRARLAHVREELERPELAALLRDRPGP
jgi:hypothetical protein